MHRSISRRARPIGVSALLAIALVATPLATGAWSDPGDPVAAPAPPRDATMVPVSSAEVTCPDGWRGFNNPALHYSLCYPNGWGFTDFTTIGPLPSVLARSLRNLHLVSTNAFPWVPGTQSFDAIADGVIDVELTVRRDGVGVENECAPVAKTPLDTTALFCEQNYDALGLPADDGPVRALKIEIPLRSAPDLDPVGASLQDSTLLVTVRTAQTQEEVDLAWQLVRSIRTF